MRWYKIIICWSTRSLREVRQSEANREYCPKREMVDDKENVMADFQLSRGVSTRDGIL